MNPWKRKRNGRGLLSMFLALAMVCSLLAGTGVAAVAAEAVTEAITAADEDYGVMTVASVTGLVYIDEDQGVTFGFVSTDGSTEVDLTDMTRTDSGGTITTEISGGKNKGKADEVTSFDENIRVIVPATFTVSGTEYTVTGYYGGNSYKRYGIKEIVWPETLTSMTGGQSAFRYYQDLESLTIPGTVKSPEVGGFYSPSIKTLTLEKGVETYNANNKMLWSGSMLETVILPSTLTTLGSTAFYEASNLKTVNLPDSLIDLGSQVFQNCTSLTSIMLPSGITEIPSSLFSGCTALSDVTFNAAVESIGNKAFYNCNSLALDEDVFKNVVELGEYAFYGCRSLESLNLSSLAEVPLYAFYGCTLLSNVVLSSELTSIGDSAFYNCSGFALGSLGSYTQLQSIGEKAFYGCASLSGGDSYTYKVTQDASETKHYTQDTENGIETTYENVFTIPDSVTSIGTAAFYKTTGVSAFWVGSGIDTVESQAFASDSNLTTIIFNNARENVTIASGSIPDSVEAYVWLEESIGDVGDAISENENALTLQQAVYYIAGSYTPDADADLTGIDTDTATITVSKHIKLSSTLDIPAGCKVTITSIDGWILQADSGLSPSMEALIEINADASLTLGGSLVISGLFNTSSVASVSGTMTIEDDVVIRKSNISSNLTGVIGLSGKSAILNIAGGSIQECTISSATSAVVLVNNGATVNMSGGRITNNRETYSINGSFGSSSAGLTVFDGTFNMSGGEISNNIGYHGGAVKIYNSSNTTVTPVFNMTGGTICGNGYTNNTSYTCGAVFVCGQAAFYMSGGEISGNSGVQGGGVTVSSYWELANAGRMKHAVFEMTGGTISDNSANNGGGIYSFSYGVTLSGGCIENNSAGSKGGGIYCEGGKIEGQYGSVTLLDCFVSENTAETHGGGLWLCPTGSAVVRIEKGGAIAGNSAGEAGDDIVSGKSVTKSYSLTLANRLLGGGAVSWYKDGDVSILDLSGNGYTNTITDVERYTPGESKLYESVIDYNGNLAAKAVLADESALSYAMCQAKLIITGNSASYGGGIGANGGVIVGQDIETPVSVTVNKVWKNDDGGIISDTAGLPEITVRLIGANSCTCDPCPGGDTCVCGSAVLDTAVLNESNGWSYTWTDLPTGDYSVKEISVDGYETTITGNASEGFVVTNTHIPETVDVSGSKTWDDADNQDGKRPSSITIRLYADGELVESKTVTASDNWVYSFENLPKYKGGVEIVYSITEDAVSEYATTYDGYNVTNSYTPGQTSVTVTKTWNDANNQDGKRPSSITIRLYADGVEIDSATVTEADGWSWSFTGLDRYHDGGVEIVYSITEDAVSEYATTYDGYNVTNSYTPKQTSVTVTKAWDDADNQDGIRPDAITVVLLADGLETGDTLTLNGDNEWTGSFTGLDEYKDGVKIVYTIQEISVDGYTVVITGDASEGFVVTNTHTPETIEISGSKTWDDADNQDGTSDSPQTGDSSHLPLWLMLMLLSLVGMAGTIAAGRRTRYCGAHETKHGRNRNRR